jgi:hypothetical protein
MLISPDKQGKIVLLIIVLAILILIGIIEKYRKHIYHDYRKVVFDKNGALYKFIIDECNNDETIRNCILVSMSDFQVFKDNVEEYIVNEVKDKIKKDGYEWLNLNSKHSGIYDSSCPIEITVMNLFGSEEISDLLYNKYINIIYDGFHFGMKAEQEAIEYYQKHGADAEGDDLHPAETKKEESSEDEGNYNNIVMEDEN